MLIYGLWLEVRMTTDIKTEIGHRVRQDVNVTNDERRDLWTEADLIIKQLMRTELWAILANNY